MRSMPQLLSSTTTPPARSTRAPHTPTSLINTDCAALRLAAFLPPFEQARSMNTARCAAREESYLRSRTAVLPSVVDQVALRERFGQRSVAAAARVAAESAPASFLTWDEAELQQNDAWNDAATAVGPEPKLTRANEVPSPRTPRMAPPPELPLVFAEAVAGAGGLQLEHGVAANTTPRRPGPSTAAASLLDGGFADFADFADFEMMMATASTVAPAAEYYDAECAAFEQPAAKEPLFFKFTDPAEVPGPAKLQEFAYAIGDEVVVRRGLKLALSLGRDRALQAGQVAVVALVHSADTVSLEERGLNLGSFGVANLDLHRAADAATTHVADTHAGSCGRGSCIHGRVGACGACASTRSHRWSYDVNENAASSVELLKFLGKGGALLGICGVLVPFAVVGETIKKGPIAGPLHVGVSTAKLLKASAAALCAEVAEFGPERKATWGLDEWVQRNWQDYKEKTLNREQIAEFREIERHCGSPDSRWVHMINEAIKESSGDMYNGPPGLFAATHGLFEDRSYNCQSKLAGKLPEGPLPSRANWQL